MGKDRIFKHKDLLDIDQFSQEEVYDIFETARKMYQDWMQPKKKAPFLEGKKVVLFFSEPSTRTRMSFEFAGGNLSGITTCLFNEGSSIQKGESLKDTALTIQAMQPDVIVLRHSSSGAAAYLAKQVSCSVINAGDGWHAHPTQALLDGYSLWEFWGKEFKGKTVLIVGDTGHSRVCRSNILLLKLLGAQVRLCSPRTLLPQGVCSWPVEIFTSLKDAVKGVDAIISLRPQLERQKRGIFPSHAEYARRFCLRPEHVECAHPEVKVLHPGPFQRGLDVSSSVVNSSNSIIFNQVTAGVAIRMAILFLFTTHNHIG